MDIKKIVLRGGIAIFLCLLCSMASAQRLSVRTNALGWATLSPNAGFELTLSDRVSVAMHASFNLMQDANWQANHLSISAEVRYWIARPSIGHFIAVGSSASTYNIRLNGKPYAGDLLAMGVGYGYSLPLSKRWNFEPQIMIGYGRLKEFSSGQATFTPARIRWTPTVTRLGLSFVYVIK